MKIASNTAAPRRRRRLSSSINYWVRSALTACLMLLRFLQPAVWLQASRSERRRRLARAMRVGAAWCAIVVVALPPLPANVSAAEYYWDNDGSPTNNNIFTGANLGGSPGVWDTTTNAKWWLNGALSDTAWINGTNTAVFQGGTAGTVSLGSNVDVGGVKFNTNGYTISTGANKLNFANVGATPNVITLNGALSATISGQVDGDGSMLVSGGIYGGQNAATLTFTGTSATGWSGATTINNGMTVVVAGASQALVETSTITLNNGNLTLLNAVGEGAINRVNDSAAIIANGLSQITFSNSGGAGNTYSETLGALTLNSGQLTILYPNTPAISSTQSLTFQNGTGLAAHTGNSSVVSIITGTALGTTTNRVNITGQATSNAGAIIGAWATAGTISTTLDYAAYGANGVFMRGNASTGTVDTSWGTTWSNDAAGNITFGSAAVATNLSTNHELNTLRYVGSGSTLALGTFNLRTQGILQAGTGALTINNAASGGGTISTAGSPDNLLFITTGTTLGIAINAPIVDNGANAVTLVKSGAATLTLGAPTSGASNYSGGTVINAGTISINADARLGAAGTGITFAGNGTLNTTVATDLANRTITLSNGSLATFNYAAATSPTISGKVTGNGGIVILSTGTATSTVALTSTSGVNGNNDFWGPIRISPASTGTTTLAAASLADSVDANGAIRLGGAGTGLAAFQWSNAALTALVLSNRQIDLASATTGGGVLDSANTNAANTITVNTDLLVSGGAGAKTLNLTGVNTGTNAFNGKINDGPSSVISLSKGGAGTWAVSGNNAYSGGTTVSGGQLIAANAGSLGTGNAVVTTGTLMLQNSAALNSAASLIVTGGGAINLRSDTNNDSFNAVVTAFTSASTGTISVDRLASGSNNTLKLGPVALGSSANSSLVITSGNGYGLSLGTVSQTNTAGATVTINNLATSLTMSGFSSSSNSAAAKLNITGTGTTVITGNILMNGAGTLSLERGTNTGTLVLQGTGNFTGPTTISNGTLQTAVATNALGSTSVINIGGSGVLALRSDADATFGNGTTAYNVMTNAAGATINIDSASGTTSNKIITLGNLSMANGHSLNVTSANGYTLSMGALAATGAVTVSPNGASLIIASANSSAGITLTGNTTGNSIGAIAATTLFKSGTSTWTLTGANTYSGATTVQNGTLRMGVASAIPATSAVSVVTNAAGTTATLDLNGYNQSVASLTLGGGTGSSATSQAVVNLNGATLTLGGNVGFLAGGTPLGALISGGTLNLGSVTHTFNIADSSTAAIDLDVTSQIAGDASSGFGKAGLGVMRITTSNTFSGGVTVSAGTLLLSSSNTFNGNVLVNGGTLLSAANNTFNGNVAVTSGTLTLTGDNAFNGNASLVGNIALQGNNNFTGNAALGGSVILLGANNFSNTLVLAGTVQFTTSNSLNAPGIVGSGGLNFIGNTSQTMSGPITLSNSLTLAANGTAGATITFDNDFRFSGDDASTSIRSTLSLVGTGTGYLTGTLEQTYSAAQNSDILVLSGNWTMRDGDFLVADDVLVTGATAVLNLDSSNMISFLPYAGNTLVSTSGGIVNLGADDVFGVNNSGGLDSIYVGDTYNFAGDGSGTLNTNSFRITTPRLDLGKVGKTLSATITGTGTVIVTETMNLARGTISAKLAGAATIYKYDTGDVFLTGDNSGLTGTSVVVNSGNLILDYTSNNALKLSTSAAASMNGGTLTVLGSFTAPTTQTLGGLDLSTAKSSNIVVQNGIGQTAVLNLGAINRPTGGGVIQFTLPTLGAIKTSTPNSGGILGGYALVVDGTGTYFARNDGSGNIAKLSYAAAKNDVTTWQTGDHITDEGTGFFGTLPSTISINTLRFNAAGGSTLNVGNGNVLNIASGAVLMTDQVVDGPATIVGGALTTDNGEFIFNQNSASQTLTVSSAIVGDVAVTKVGVGTVVLNGANDFTGPTAIAAGTLIATGLGDNAPVTLADSQAAGLQLLTDEVIGSLSGGNATSGSLFGIVALGENDLTIRQSTSATYAGVLTGSGTLTKEGAGELNLIGNSGAGFTGAVNVKEGVLRISRATGNLNGAASFTVNKGAAFMLDGYNNTGEAINANRISNTASVTLHSADGTLSGETIVQGFANRQNDDYKVWEFFGALTLGSGANYVTLSIEAGASNGAWPELVASDLIRTNNSTLDVRGVNLAYASDKGRSQLHFAAATTETAFMASSLIGGGGAAGTKTISIVPWIIGENVVSSSTLGINEMTDANMGNSFVTYGAGTGFRALDWATEYATFSTATATSNVRESLTSDLTAVPGQTVNALVLHNQNTSPTNVQVLGSGAGQALNITSGAMLFTLNPTAASGNYRTTLGGFDDGITVGGTNEYVIHVVDPTTADPTVALTAEITSPLTSAADITKAGRGTLRLSGVNTAGGGARSTTINEGALEISDLDNIGGDTGSLIFAGGALRLGAGFTDGVSTRTINILGGGGTLNTFGHNTTLAGGLDDAAPDAENTFTKAGDGVLTLQGSSSFIGTFVVGNTASGTAADGDALALVLNGDVNAALSGNLQIGSGTLPAGNFRAAVALANNEQIADAATISFNGAASKEAYFKLMGFTETVAGIVDASGSGVIENVENSEAGVTTDGTLILSGSGNYSFNGVLRNHGGGANVTTLKLEKDGSGNQTLAGQNTFSGGVAINGGTLTVAAAENAGVSGPLGSSGLISFGGGTLRFTATNTFDYSGRISTSAGQAVRIDTNGQSVGFASNLTSSGGSLAKIGAGTLTLSGSNTYNGGTTVSGGTLRVGNSSALGTGPVALSGVGSTLRLSGNDLTVGGLTAALSGPIVENADASTAAKLTVNLASGTNSYAGVIQNGGAATLGFVKQGAGTLSLGGANTYTGATSVAAGTLNVNGSLGNTAVTVGGGATLGGNGSLAGGVTSSGTIAGGLTIAGTVNSVGTITPGGAGTVGTLTLGSLVLGGGSLNLDLGSLRDQIWITGGAFNITAATNLNLSALTGFDVGTYDLISGFTGAIGGFGFLSSPTTLAGYSLSLADVGGVLRLTVTGGPVGPTARVWTGASSAIWNTSTANWTGTGSIYTDGDSVTFNDTSSVTTLTIASAVAPEHVVVSTTNTYTLLGAPINGAADLLKQGTGTLVLAGSHGFTGPTTVAGGTLQLGGDYQSDVALQNATLQFNTATNQTITGVISGSGYLQKLGSGTTTLLGLNTFSGITSVDAGTLVVNHALSGTVFVNTGGAFSGTGASASQIVVQGGSGTISGTQTGAINLASGSINVVNGGLTTGTVNVTGGLLTIESGGRVGNTLGVNITGGAVNVQSGGQIVGNGQITVGSGTLSIDGDVEGRVIVQSGGVLNGTGSVGGITVQSGGTLSVGHSVGTLTLDGGGLPGNQPSLQLNGGSNLVFEFNNATGTPGNPAGGWDYIELGAGTLTLNATGIGSDKINLHIDSLTLANVHGTAANFNAAPGSPGNSQIYHWKFIGLSDTSNIFKLGYGSINGLFDITDDALNAGVFDTTNGNPFTRPVSAYGQGTFKVVAGDYGQGSGLYIYYNAIPEPGSMILTGIGVLAAGWYGKRRRKQQATTDAATAESQERSDAT